MRIWKVFLFPVNGFLQCSKIWSSENSVELWWRIYYNLFWILRKFLVAKTCKSCLYWAESSGIRCNMKLRRSSVEEYATHGRQRISVPNFMVHAEEKSILINANPAFVYKALIGASCPLPIFSNCWQFCTRRNTKRLTPEPGWISRLSSLRYWSLLTYSTLSVPLDVISVRNVLYLTV